MHIKLSIPQTWNDLTEMQLQNVVYQFHCYQEIIKDSPDAAADTATKLYFQVSKELLRGNKWKAIRTALREIRPKAFVPFTKFLYGTVARTKFIPSVKVNGTVFHAPGQRMRNCNVGEFSYVDAVFYRWRKSKEDIWLDVLCAALYREAAEKPTDIDLRKPFVKQAVDYRADIFGSLPLKTKLAIAYTYEGTRNHIAETFPLIFPKPIKVEGQVTPKQQKYISFGEIILDKIEGDPSKLERSNNVNMYDFLNIVNTDMKNLRKKKK
ncbi:MAG: hypothetical protein WBG90_18410 [Saonia sp.]